MDTIGILINFSLSGTGGDLDLPGDQFSMTSLFRVRVPAPGALAVLGLGGLAFRRRRRRS